MRAFRAVGLSFIPLPLYFYEERSQDQDERLRAFRSSGFSLNYPRKRKHRSWDDSYCDAAPRSVPKPLRREGGITSGHFDFSRILETWKFPSEFLFPKRLERSEAVERLERFERAQLR
jgi:hypothetical protein